MSLRSLFVRKKIVILLEGSAKVLKTKTVKTLPKMALGTVHSQVVRCGKPSCKCASGELHGPYFYHFQRINGSLVKRYVKAADVADMRAACDARRKNRRQESSARKASVRTLQQMLTKLREIEQTYSARKES